MRQGGRGRAQVCWTMRRCRDWRGARRISCGTSPSTIRCCWCGAVVGLLLLLPPWHPTVPTDARFHAPHAIVLQSRTSITAGSPGLVQGRSYTQAREGVCHCAVELCTVHNDDARRTATVRSPQENLLDPDHGLYAHQVGCAAVPCAHLFGDKFKLCSNPAGTGAYCLCVLESVLDGSTLHTSRPACGLMHAEYRGSGSCSPIALNGPHRSSHKDGSKMIT